MDWFPTLALRDKIQDITRRLTEAYHAERPHYAAGRNIPPVDELVLTVLSQSTTDVNSIRGYQALRARFAKPTAAGDVLQVDWDAVADAPEVEIEEIIRPCGLSRQKAPRIQALLRRIREEHGRITLDHLAEMPVDAALAYLMSFHGVGRKTASCVLLFALEMPALPVDTHVLRGARRLELLPATATADQAHDLLEALLPEEDYLPFHINMVAHGRHTCTARQPACPRCPVLNLCPTGQRAFGRGPSDL